MSIGIVISSEHEELRICFWSDGECTPSYVFNDPIVSWFNKVMCSDIKIISEFSGIVIWAEKVMIWMCCRFNSINCTIDVLQQEVCILWGIIGNSDIEVFSKSSRFICGCGQVSRWDCEWSDGYYNWELRILHFNYYFCRKYLSNIKSRVIYMEIPIIPYINFLWLKYN